MTRLTIEIHGTGTHNRGAELMAIAIAEQVRARFPGARIAVPAQFGDFAARADHGFYITDELYNGVRARVIARLMSPRFRALMGVINVREVDAVLDASGFAFSDQWGAKRATNLLRKMQRPKRRRQPLLLLPQALGPFEDSQVAASSRALFQRAVLVCARDQQSFTAAQKLGGTIHLRQYPDFTLAVKPYLPDSVQLPEQFTAIVPNLRMLDKGQAGEAYIALLQCALTTLRNMGLNPLFLLHDADEDQNVVKRLKGDSFPIITHRDPVVLKGILGRATFVIGSRFHALVSSLSQGIPCIGVGWSHKYPELFRDFHASTLLLPDLFDHQSLENLIRTLADFQQRALWSQRIKTATQHLKVQTDQMWQDIEAILRKQYLGTTGRASTSAWS